MCLKNWRKAHTPVTYVGTFLPNYYTQICRKDIPLGKFYAFLGSQISLSDGRPIKCVEDTHNMNKVINFT